MKFQLRTINRAAMAATIFLAALLNTGCGKTLAQIAPYVRQSSISITNAIEDAHAAKIIKDEQYSALQPILKEYREYAPQAADLLQSLTTLDATKKEQVIGKLSEGIALGNRISLAAGLPPESTTARVIAAVILGLDTWKSTIEAVKIGEASFSSVGGSSPSEIPASSIKVNLPKMDADVKRYFQN